MYYNLHATERYHTHVDERLSRAEISFPTLTFLFPRSRVSNTNRQQRDAEWLYSYPLTS